MIGLSNFWKQPLRAMTTNPLIALYANKPGQTVRCAFLSIENCVARKGSLVGLQIGYSYDWSTIMTGKGIVMTGGSTVMTGRKEFRYDWSTVITGSGTVMTGGSAVLTGGSTVMTGYDRKEYRFELLEMTGGSI